MHNEKFYSLLIGAEMNSITLENNLVINTSESWGYIDLTTQQFYSRSYTRMLRKAMLSMEKKKKTKIKMEKNINAQQ